MKDSGEKLVTDPSDKWLALGASWLSGIQRKVLAELSQLYSLGLSISREEELAEGL